MCSWGAEAKWAIQYRRPKVRARTENAVHFASNPWVEEVDLENRSKGCGFHRSGDLGDLGVCAVGEWFIGDIEPP